MAERGKGRILFWDSISPALRHLLNLAIRLPVTLPYLTAGGRTVVASEVLEALVPLSLPHAHLGTSAESSSWRAVRMEQGPPQGQQFLRPLPLIPQLFAAAYPISSIRHPLIQLLTLGAFSRYLSGCIALAHPCLPPNHPLYAFPAPS